MSWTSTVLSGITKIAFIGGSAYALYAVGVFSSDTRKTEAIYKRVTREIMPGTVELKENLPSKKEFEQAVATNVNSGVDCVFDFIRSAPTRFRDGIQTGFQAAKEVALDFSDSRKQ